MNKCFRYFIVVIFSILMLSNTKGKGRKLSGSYYWQYTMVENEALLIRQISTDINGLKFTSNYTFSEIRAPRCGNDISYHKKGRYYFSKSKLILKYTGGEFEDNVGGDTKQIYVRGSVFYTVNRITNDTLVLTRVKGNSEKKISKLETAK